MGHDDSALCLVDVVHAESVVASAFLGRIAFARHGAVLDLSVGVVAVAAPALQAAHTAHTVKSEHGGGGLGCTQPEIFSDMVNPERCTYIVTWVSSKRLEMNSCMDRGSSSE